MQYGMAYTMIRGIEDFLAGPDVLHDGGPAALAAIRAERSEFAETVVHPAVKIGELTDAVPRIHPRGHLPRKDRINLVLAKRVVFQWLGPSHPRAGRHRGRGQPVVARLAVRPRGGHRCFAVRRADPTPRQAEADELTQANDEGAATVPQRRRRRCRRSSGRALPELIEPRELGTAVRQLISAGARRPVRCCPCRPDTRRCGRSFDELASRPETRAAASRGS